VTESTAHEAWSADRRTLPPAAVVVLGSVLGLAAGWMMLSWGGLASIVAPVAALAAALVLALIATPVTTSTVVRVQPQPSMDAEFKRVLANWPSEAVLPTPKTIEDEGHRQPLQQSVEGPFVRRTALDPTSAPSLLLNAIRFNSGELSPRATDPWAHLPVHDASTRPPIELGSAALHGAIGSNVGDVSQPASAPDPESRSTRYARWSRVDLDTLPIVSFDSPAPAPADDPSKLPPSFVYPPGATASAGRPTPVPPAAPPGMPPPSPPRSPVSSVLVQRVAVAGEGGVAAPLPRVRRPAPSIPYIVREGSHDNGSRPSGPPPRPMVPPTGTRPHLAADIVASSEVISDKSLDEVILAYLEQGEKKE
jgi:hypothetical protein